MNLFNNLSNCFSIIHTFVFETFILPLTRFLNLTAFSAEAYNGTELFLLGIVQCIVLYTVIRPLERRYPAELTENKDDRRLDFLYTLFHRLGFFALILFFILTPLMDSLETQLRLWEFERFQLDDFLGNIDNKPVLSFILYFIVFDFVGYWIHRFQHQIKLWWQLHALHHSTQSMSLWSDTRNHVFDDFILATLFAMMVALMGAEPSQFVLITMVTKMLQSWQHANVKLPDFKNNYRYLNGIKTLCAYCLVSPTFHRIHHTVKFGYQGPPKGCNFGVVLPWWDILFKTAEFKVNKDTLGQTGVSDQLKGRYYGQTMIQQQWFGLLRLLNKA